MLVIRPRLSFFLPFPVLFLHHPHWRTAWILHIFLAGSARTGVSCLAPRRILEYLFASCLLCSLLEPWRLVLAFILVAVGVVLFVGTTGGKNRAELLLLLLRF